MRNLRKVLGCSRSGRGHEDGRIVREVLDEPRHVTDTERDKKIGDHLFDIVPGKPDDSILPFRMASHETGVMMPEQGRSTTHVEGLKLIRDWIAEWPGGCES